MQTVTDRKRRVAVARTNKEIAWFGVLQNKHNMRNAQHRMSSPMNLLHHCSQLFKVTKFTTSQAPICAPLTKMYVEARLVAHPCRPRSNLFAARSPSKQLESCEGARLPVVPCPPRGCFFAAPTTSKQIERWNKAFRLLEIRHLVHHRVLTVPCPPRGHLVAAPTSSKQFDLRNTVV